MKQALLPSWNGGSMRRSGCQWHLLRVKLTQSDRLVACRDLQETYLPAFEACVRDALAASIMCSYNAVNGVPACANVDLLQHTLREEWGFKGFVVSDCAAVQSVWWPHKYTK